MKKLLAYIILILFVYNLAGYYVVFKSWQKCIRHEIKEMIRHDTTLSEIEVLSFSKADLKEKKILLEWEKVDEFGFNNCMYDVINQKESADSITYVCFNDRKEKKLIDQFQANVNQQYDNTTSKRADPFKILKNLVKDYCTQSFTVQNFKDGITINLPRITEALFDTFSDVLIPPPKLLA